MRNFGRNWDVVLEKILVTIYHSVKVTEEIIGFRSKREKSEVYQWGGRAVAEITGSRVRLPGFIAQRDCLLTV